MLKQLSAYSINIFSDWDLCTLTLPFTRRNSTVSAVLARIADVSCFFRCRASKPVPTPRK